MPCSLVRMRHIIKIPIFHFIQPRSFPYPHSCRSYRANTQSKPFHPPISEPQVWDTTTPSLAKCTPVKIHLKDPLHFLCQPQYLLPTTNLLGIQPVIADLHQKGLIRPTHSPYNTPILAVKTPNGSSRLVQDLRLINTAVKPIHPLVPNPYTILSSIPNSSLYFSVIDLKDAFFTIPLSPKSQDIFAFTWTDTHTHQSQQFTWTVLPQGFRDSPHIFGQALANDLKELTLPESTLLQYVDDLLLCSPSLQASEANTITLLNFL